MHRKEKIGRWYQGTDLQGTTAGATYSGHTTEDFCQ